MAVKFSGDVIVYFNRHADAPRVWSIASPDRSFEIEVASVDIHVSVRSHYQPTDKPRDVAPAAWLSCHGEVFIRSDGSATIDEA